MNRFFEDVAININILAQMTFEKLFHFGICLASVKAISAFSLFIKGLITG